MKGLTQKRRRTDILDVGKSTLDVEETILKRKIGEQILTGNLLLFSSGGIVNSAQACLVIGHTDQFHSIWEIERTRICLKYDVQNAMIPLFQLHVL